MNLFDKLVSQALQNQHNLANLRIVVEKELLHHDILRIMRDNNLLLGLTFIGGTCLRTCYGGTRLSEDLDFTGGNDFSRAKLSAMGKILVDNLHHKYGLKVSVQAPIKDKQNVDTWKIVITTRPEARDLPSQRINIDVCSVLSYERRPMMLVNPYGVDMGTSGLIIQVQSREEIYSDKLLAFALRPNRVKYRDIWDILWLHGQGIVPSLELIPLKLKERQIEVAHFHTLFSERLKAFQKQPNLMKEFKTEMQRFLQLEQVEKILNQENLLEFFCSLMEDFVRKIKS